MLGWLQQFQVSVVYWGAPLLSPHTHQSRHTEASISVTHVSREGGGQVRETELAIQTAPLQRTTTRRNTSSQQHESQEQNFWDKWTKREVDTCVLSCSVVSHSATPWTVARQAPLSMGFSRQEYWSGLPCPPPGALPNPGIEPGAPALQADFLPAEPPEKPKLTQSIGSKR